MTGADVTLWLLALLGVGYLGAGVAGLTFSFEGDVDIGTWQILLLGGGMLLLAGLFAWRIPTDVALVLVIVGAVVGALALAWTIVVPLLAVVLIVLAVLDLRRPTG